MKRIDCEWESLLADGHCTARVYLDKALEFMKEVPKELRSPELLVSLVQGMHSHMNASSNTVGMQWIAEGLERIAESVDGLSDALSNEKDSDEY